LSNDVSSVGVGDQLPKTLLPKLPMLQELFAASSVHAASSDDLVLV
jgi:hypothetical protein